MKSASRSLFFASVFLAASASLLMARTWEVTSPDRHQTFAFGSERSRQWIARGNHLAIAMEFTNDPYVDRVNPRQFDDFEFSFPRIILGPDGKTFFLKPNGGKPIAVAIRHLGLFGAYVSLLPSSELVVVSPHGLLRLTLLISSLDPSSE